MKKRVAIKDWEFARYGYNIVLVGRLIDDFHPRLGERSIGHRVVTSKVLNVHKEESIVETMNTLYVLIGEGKEGIADDLARERGITGYLVSKGIELANA